MEKKFFVHYTRSLKGISKYLDHIHASLLLKRVGLAKAQSGEPVATRWAVKNGYAKFNLGEDGTPFLFWDYEKTSDFVKDWLHERDLLEQLKANADKTMFDEAAMFLRSLDEFVEWVATNE